jgi:hypothetical protein
MNTYATIELLLVTGWFYVVRAEILWAKGKTSCRHPRVEAGPNTSTVTLRVVGGDENGSLKSETVKCGRESQGTRTRERLPWRGPGAYTKDRTAPEKQDRNCLTVINIWLWAPDGVRHQDVLTDWPSVAMWLWLWAVGSSVWKAVTKRVNYKSAQLKFRLWREEFMYDIWSVCRSR